MQLSGLIRGELRPSVVSVEGIASDANLDAIRSRCFLRTLESPILDKETWFAELAREFDFPDYFGKNWDAVTDCLSDLNWLGRPPARIVLLWKQPMTLFEAHPEDFFTALAVLNHGVIDRWWSRSVLFYVLLQDPNRELVLRALPRLDLDIPNPGFR